MIYNEENLIARSEAAFQLSLLIDPATDLCQDEDDTDECQENNETESDHECPYCNYQCDWCVG